MKMAIQQKMGVIAYGNKDNNWSNSSISSRSINNTKVRELCGCDDRKVRCI
jgi:hypothetical protein